MLGGPDATGRDLVQAVACLGAALYACYLFHLRWRGCRVEITMGENINKNLRKVVERCDWLNMRNGKIYRPPIWAYNGHIASTWCLVLRSSRPIDFVRVQLDLPPSESHPSGGRTSLDFIPDEIIRGEHSPRPSTPVILIIPGIASSSSNNYIRNFAWACGARGYRGVVFNHRGCGAQEALLTPELFTFGDYYDVAAAVGLCVERYPAAPLYLVGFSMGGCILANYLGKADGGPSALQRRPPQLRAALSCCQAYNCTEGVGALSPVYDRMLCEKMKSMVRRHRSIIERHLDVTEILSSTTCWEFDSRYNVRLHSHRGWQSPMDYYEAMSSLSRLDHIEVPFLLLNTADDPLVPLHLLPVDIVHHNDNIVFALTEYGGHLGFPMGGLFQPGYESFMEKVLLEFVENCEQHL